MDRTVVIHRLSDLLAHVEQCDHLDTRWLRVELEALAKSLYERPTEIDPDAPPGPDAGSGQ